jgi:uncharacterized protein (DUF1330 family)
MTTAYLVGQVSIKNIEKWKAYREQVPATLLPWGAVITFRGKLSAVLIGEHPYTDIVVIQFPSQAALNAWHESASYQALIPLRQQAAEVVLLSYTV